MPIKDPPLHLKTLMENVYESVGLVDIHAKVAGGGPGRKHGVEVLNKSALVLLVASWEAYVEDTVTAALTFMIDNSNDHTIFPTNVLERVSSLKQGIKSWELAGNGWKTALKDNLTGVLARTTGALNTPRAEQVGELFFKVIGLQNISSTWKWHNVKSAQVIGKLDRLITTRGAIAHRVRHSAPVRKKAVLDAADLVGRLSARINNETRKHIHKLTGKYPWLEIEFGGTV